MVSRTLPLLAVAFAVGIVAADAGLLPRAVALASGVHALAGALCWPAGRAGLALVVSLSAGAAAHGARLEAADAAVPPTRRELTLEGRIASKRHWGDGRYRIELDRVRAVAASRPAVPARIVLDVEPTPAPFPPFEAGVPGARVRLRARLGPVHALRNPGSGEHEARARRRGLGAEGRLVHPALHATVEPASRLRAAWHRRRRAAVDALERRGEGGALLAALALGERGALAPARREALARLGLAHVLAVSGLHLMLVAGLALALGRRLALAFPGWAARSDPRRVGLAAALLAGLVYAAATGFGVPVRRALVLLATSVLAAWRRQPSARSSALAAAALLVLAFQPAALFEPGAQLSFVATVALWAAVRTRPEAHEPEVHEPARVGRARLARGLTEGMATTAAAMAVTAPVAALHFGLAAPVGALANLVVVPLVGTLLLPAALGAALLAAFAEGPWIDGLLDLAAQAPAAFLEGVGHVAERVPARSQSPPALWAVGLAACAAWPALAARRAGLRLLAAAAGSGLLAVAPAAPLAPAPPRVVFLDVGAGDAVLVQAPQSAVLVDGGVAIPGGLDLGRAVVVPALQALGVERLDLVIASHADLDHRGGLPAVLAALPVGALWLPRGGRRDPAFEALLQAARAPGVPVYERGLGDPPQAVGGLRIVPLWPPAEGGSLGRNDRSLVVRVDAPGASALLPGDLEAEGERALLARVPGKVLRASLLKLPHHGSRTSSTAAFLDAVEPCVAVASAARFPRHPMPAPEVVQRLLRRGVALRWTGRDGAVLVALRPGLALHGLRAGRAPRGAPPGDPDGQGACTSRRAHAPPPRLEAVGRGR